MHIENVFLQKIISSIFLSSSPGPTYDKSGIHREIKEFDVLQKVTSKVFKRFKDQEVAYYNVGNTICSIPYPHEI